MGIRSFWAVIVSVAFGLAGCVAEGIDASPEGVSAAELSANSGDCDLVRCPMPLCAEGQRLSYRGGCCPVCVGQPSRCATVLCAAVACDEGEELVTSPGDCCGHCVPSHPVQECQTDDDCPVYYCITCPCPVSECRGGSCVTSTPDASTCGGATTL